MITLTTPVITATTTKHSLPKRSNMAEPSRTGGWTLGDPAIHAQTLGRGTVLVFPACAAGGSADPSVAGLEVWPVLLAVTALVRAAGGAQAISGGAAHILPGSLGLSLRMSGRLGHEPWWSPRGGSSTVSGRGDGLRLNIDIMAGVDREVGTLR